MDVKVQRNYRCEITEASVESTGVKRDQDSLLHNFIFYCGLGKDCKAASLPRLECVGSVEVSAQLHHIAVNTFYTDPWLHLAPPSGMSPVSDLPRHIHTHTHT